MANSTKAAAPKKSTGFTGVRGAFWIIVVCAIIAFTLFFTWFASPCARHVYRALVGS